MSHIVDLENDASIWLGEAGVGGLSNSQGRLTLNWFQRSRCHKGQC